MVFDSLGEIAALHLPVPRGSIFGGYGIRIFFVYSDQRVAGLGAPPQTPRQPRKLFTYILLQKYDR
jgi:hypothetical protein